MEPRISLITLGVGDLERVTRFCADVLKLPRVPMPADAGVSFFELGTIWLSLFARQQLAAEASDARFVELRAAGLRLPHPLLRSHRVGAAWEVAWNPHFPHA